MVDRVKYFLLAALFLIVAGVIAYDSWNSGGPEHASSEANVDERLRAEVDSGGVPHIDPGKLQVEPKETGKQEPKIIKNGTPVGSRRCDRRDRWGERSRSAVRVAAGCCATRSSRSRP